MEPSVRGRHSHVVDHDDFPGTGGAFEFQPKLLVHGVRQRPDSVFVGLTRDCSEGFLYSDYSVASTVLLEAASTAVREFGDDYHRHIEAKTLIGSILPERHKAGKFFVRDLRVSQPLSDKTFHELD